QIYPDAEIIAETIGTEKFVRPLFNKMVEKCEEGDMIVCTKLDRFCRSIGEGVRLVDELLSKGIAIHILNMGIIDDSETG
ncbi:recombinase family protein, partial [Acinetobacter sp. 163]|nr:recombinase family protein [Acinetobacter sp. 163]